MFPIGEEFGWRGFAQPRMVQRYGNVKGTSLLGTFWGLWHLAYSITPQAAGFDGVEFAMTMLELPLYSLIIAWVFERSNRSMAVAIAFHEGFSPRSPRARVAGGHTAARVAYCGDRFDRGARAFAPMCDDLTVESLVDPMQETPPALAALLEGFCQLRRCSARWRPR